MYVVVSLFIYFVHHCVISFVSYVFMYVYRSFVIDLCM